MSKYWLILSIIMLGFLVISFSQTDLSDGINNGTSDSIRVQLLIDLANECRYNDPDDLMRYNREALKLSEESSFSLGEGLALKGMGSYFFDKADYDSAIYYFNRAEFIFGNLGDESEMTEILGNYCYLCVAQGEYNKAFEAGLKALEIAENSKNESNIQHAYTFIGYIYHSIGKLDEALSYYEQANKLANKTNDLKGISTIKSNMAMVYDRKGDYSNAIKLFAEAYEVIENTDNPQLMSLSIFNKAEAYRCQGNIQQAIKSYFRAYNITSELNDHNGKILLLTRIARAYIEQIKKGYSVHQIDKLIVTAGFSNIDHLLISTIDKLEKANNKNDLLFFHESLIELYKSRGDYRNVFNCITNLIDLKDDLAGINRGIAVSQLTFQFENEQKQKELTLLELQSEANAEKIKIYRQQLTIVVILVILLVIIGIGLWTRISTVKKLKDKIQRSNDLLSAEKTRAEKGEHFKERFLANLSHEIRTPMNAIMGITNLLIRNKHYKDQEEYLDALRISSQHLLLLINDILDLAKLEAGKFGVEKSLFSITEIYQKVDNELGKAAVDKGLKLLFKIEPKVPEFVYGDQYMLFQILLNLCRNAVEFTEKGIIEVNCLVVEQSEKSLMLSFIVKDTGIGIRQEIRDKIFSEFIGDIDFDKRYIDQSGLGLLLVKQMLHLQGGNIRLETKKGKGSAFIFELSYEINDVDKQLIVLEKNKEPKSLQGIKILLVEDNEFNIMVAKDELEDAIENVQIEVAENGKLAIDLIKNTKFDIVLMDIQMPVMNGYESTAAIRSLNGDKGNIPIIAMTANNIKTEVEKCYKAGMNDYISKPFETELLVRKITSAIS